MILSRSTETAVSTADFVARRYGDEEAKAVESWPISEAVIGDPPGVPPRERFGKAGGCKFGLNCGDGESWRRAGIEDDWLAALILGELYVWLLLFANGT